MCDLGTEYMEISEVLYNHLPETAPRQINYCQPFIVYKMNAAINMVQPILSPNLPTLASQKLTHKVMAVVGP